MKVYANKSKNSKGKSLRKITASTDYESLRQDYRYDDYEYLNPEDCLATFVDNYSQSNDYIGDAISEHADSCVEIYNSELCKSCWDIYQSGAYEEAKFNGLLEGADDLIKLLQACQYEFYSGVLYENLDAVMCNLVLTYLEEEGIDVDELQWDEVCDTYLTDVDNNDRIGDVCEKVADFLNGTSGDGDEEA